MDVTFERTREKRTGSGGDRERTRGPRGLIYLRVSSIRQAEKDYDEEGFSIPAQRGGCLRKAEAMGVPVGSGDEYVDRGESAKTADRPALQAMLRRVETDPSVGYVFVHKLDRLARNRADDIAIVARIRAAGAQVVSVSENIDETPSGVLLHGIMASIAEFYSRNLATEILKGSTQKAKSGGTPTKAPIGYLNVREVVEGREIRTIALDPERAPLIRHAFELYATGDYALSDLALIIEKQGLRTRPTPRSHAKSLGVNRLHKMLRNDYYVGVVHYRGHSYPGRHEPLIPLPLFQRVQEQLEAKRLAGERERIHHHYLKGTLYCGECGGRLIFSRNTGRRGTAYDYFLCRGKQLQTCSQRYRPVEAIEEAVIRYYSNVQLTDEQREHIRSVLHERFDGLAEVAKREIARASKELDRLDEREDKLLERHYAGKVSERVYDRQFEQIQRDRAAAQKTLEDLNVSYEEIRSTLDSALDLTRNIQAAYYHASSIERRFFNQAFFERLEILEDEVSGATVAQPYASLLEPGVAGQEPDGTGAQNVRTPVLSKVGGSITANMVELARLELATSWVRSIGRGSQAVIDGSRPSPKS
jgi:site-specific DNA recombinase